MWDDDIPTEEEAKELIASMNPKERSEYDKLAAETDEYLRKYYAQLWRDEKLAARRCKVINMNDWFQQRLK